ncbi:hypothetical protein [Blastopirellula marina]|uniref:Uncharacterized protein n=1 Tax=Blastopirellula marina DSM 3645 TaxID=314230 RepID=A3ZUY4_9BACT|nr:hypothetical protein [Blastopirellula marina]EAQ79720.1 hypothetical protein DSM3645_24465 [Blastopirellula marina DSM 3645]
MPKNTNQTDENGEIIVDTQARAAAFFGVNPRTIKEWRRRGAPVIETGIANAPYRYALGAISQWLIAEREAQAAKEAPSASGSDLERQKLQEQVRALQLGNDLRQTKYVRLVNTLVCRKAVEKTFKWSCDKIRNRCESLPSEIVATMPAKYRDDLQEEAAHLIGLILKELKCVSVKTLETA